jgi:multidrug efflux pump
VRDNPNTVNVNQDWGKIFTQRVVIDSDKARGLGIPGHNLSLNLQTVLNGFVITRYREGDELIDIEARGMPEERGDLGTLKDISVYTTNGRYVPLDQVAYLKSGTEEGIIWRRQGFSTITVRSEVAGTAQAVDVAKQIDKNLTKIRAQLPPGYNIETAGVVLSSQTAQASIVAVLPFAVAAMMFLLMLQLRSFQRVILVFITAPLGIIGVTLALLLFHLPFGFVAMLGVISLAGMIMRNSVILIDQIEKHMAAQMTPRAAIVQATVERFRPIILTAAAAILAMIPLLQSTFWKPMAAAIMGGLFVATLLTVLFLPALYAAWFAWSNKVEIA